MSWQTHVFSSNRNAAECYKLLLDGSDRAFKLLLASCRNLCSNQQGFEFEPLFRWLASRKTEIRGSRGSLVLSLSRRRSNPLWTFRQRALRPWEQLLNAIQNGQWHSFELNRPGVRARGSKRTDGCTLKGCPKEKRWTCLWHNFRIFLFCGGTGYVWLDLCCRLLSCIDVPFRLQAPAQRKTLKGKRSAGSWRRISPTSETKADTASTASATNIRQCCSFESCQKSVNTTFPCALNLGGLCKSLTATMKYCCNL